MSSNMSKQTAANVDEENVERTKEKAPDAEELKPEISDSNIGGLEEVVERPNLEQKTCGVHVPTGEYTDKDDKNKERSMKARRLGTKGRDDSQE